MNIVVTKPVSRNKAIHTLWSRGCLEWKFHAGQRHIYNTVKSLPKDTREALFFCSRRWGKSYLGIIMALERCLQKPNIEVAIIGPNLKQTKNIITPIINKICIDAPAGMVKQTKSELVWKVGKSTLVIAAFDTAAEACRGRDFEDIFLEESALADPEEYDYIMNSILRPTLMHSKGRIYHLTTPPKLLNHPLLTITLPKCKLGNSFFEFTIESNPLLTKEDIEKEIQEMGGRGNPNCERELFCGIIKDESSLVIPEFRMDCVKKIDLPTHYNPLTAIDIGGAQDKHAILIGYYDFLKAKVVIYREALLEKNTPSSEVISTCLSLEQQFRQHTPNRLGDMPEQLRIDLSSNGFITWQPLKEPGSVEANINALRLAFHRGEIEIDESCKLLQSTLEFGSWQSSKKDWQRTPELGHLDLLAAMLYFYKHLNKTNPYSLHSLGISINTHGIPPQYQRSSLETNLKQAFSPRRK